MTNNHRIAIDLDAIDLIEGLLADLKERTIAQGGSLIISPTLIDEMHEDYPLDAIERLTDLLWLAS